ncbi:MAG TPA: hypothetical protein VIY49_11430 [Bryobacteraceae bacterium]
MAAPDLKKQIDHDRRPFTHEDENGSRTASPSSGASSQRKALISKGDSEEGLQRGGFLFS